MADSTPIPDVRLHRLVLRNFRGTAHREIIFAGESATVYGDTGAGKTTVADALAWLTTGKDLAGRPATGGGGFAIKTLDEAGDAAHGLEHEVEATFGFPSGRAVTLRKVFREIWSKPRGQSVAELSGHTVDHYVDGVPVRAGDYEAALAEIADAETWRLLSDPLAFSEKAWQEGSEPAWQKRRALLMAIGGDVSDLDVIRSDSELADLEPILAGRQPEHLRAITRASRRSANKRRGTLPAEISAIRRVLPEAGKVSAKALAAVPLLAQAREKRSGLEERRAEIRAGGEVARLTAALREIEAREAEHRRAAEAARDERISGFRVAWQQAHDRHDAAEFAKIQAERAFRIYTTSIDHAEEHLAKAEAQLRARTEAALPDVETACPTCERALPEDRVEEARSALRLARSRELAACSAVVSEAAAEVAIAEAAAEAPAAAFAAAVEAVAAAKAAVISTAAALEAARAAQGDDPGPDPQIEAEKRNTLELLECAKQGSAASIAELDAEIKDVDVEISDLEAQIAKLDQRTKCEEEIAELMAEERRLGTLLESLDRTLLLLDLFVQTKVRMLEDPLNERFEVARFKLFRIQVNGELEVCCEVMKDGVPWADVNRGGKIQLGMDVIRTLQRHFGVAVPVVVDDAEKVTSLPGLDCQVLRFEVSRADKDLRVHLEIDD